MNLGGLGEQQARAYAQSNGSINIWEGAVRAGKTVSSLLRCAKYVTTPGKMDGGIFVVTGKTLETIKRNVFAPLESPAIMGDYARLTSYTAGAATGRILGREVAVISGNDERAEERLRGLTACGWYADEASLLPEHFFDQLVARASVAGAQGFATTNPGARNHWFKIRYIDQAWQATGPDIRSWRFGLDDNPSLTRDYVELLKALYVGMWYKRMILGEWVMAEGAIYDAWNPDTMVTDTLPDDIEWLALGIDYGTTNPFSALLMGVGTEAGIARLYFGHEWRYDSRKAGGRQMDDKQYSDAVKGWLAGLELAPGVLGITPRYTFVDPSAASFRLRMHRDGARVYPADNSVGDGIRTMASVIGSDRLRVHRRCAGLLGEIGSYSWDPDKAKKGLDEPIKQDDHSCDAARYAMRTSEAFWHKRVFPRGVPAPID